jgi:hypothetical protein
VVPVDRNGKAVAAGYLGLVSIVVVFLGPLAIALGVMGLRAIGGGAGHGRGRCWFGIVTGVWGTFWTIVVLATA